MTPHSSLFLLVDRVLEGTLEERLRSWTEAGMSKYSAALLLLQALEAALPAGREVVVSPETVRRWMADAAEATAA